LIVSLLAKKPGFQGFLNISGDLRQMLVVTKTPCRQQQRQKALSTLNENSTQAGWSMQLNIVNEAHTHGS
jgi:hypothetical protein